MTVYSKLASSQTLNNFVVEKVATDADFSVSAPGKWGRVNLYLLLSAGVLVFIYIFLSNFIASNIYAADSLKASLNSASIELENKISGFNRDSANLGAIYNFAARTGMVEAKETESLFEESKVAAGEAFSHRQ